MAKRQRLALLATILGSAVVFLDGAVVNLALPSISRELHVPFSGLQWVIDGYLLTLSTLLLLGGSLGDIVGRKKVYLLGMIGFAASSLLCGIAPSGAVLIAMRALQGVFGALMVPGALAIIETNIAPAMRGRAIAIWTASTSAFIAAGPLIGGYLVDAWSWRLIFFINLPLLVIAYMLGAANIKETKDEWQRHLDVPGAVLAALGLGGVTYGLIEGPATHWELATKLCLIGGTIACGLFIWNERKHKDPMLNLKLFRSHNFSSANATTLAMYGALGGFFFALPIHLQTVLHYSTLQSGMSALPVTICMVGLSPRFGSLASKYGPRLFMSVGPLLAGLAMLLLLPLGAGDQYVTRILPGIFLFGLGMSMTVAPLTTTILASVSMRDSGIASAVNNAVSRVAGLLVIALLGLYGASHAYRFAAGLCATLAIIAGVTSFIFVTNHAKPLEVR